MTNEMELENKKEEVRMPWQGKVWLSFFCFGIIFHISIIPFFDNLNSESLLIYPLAIFFTFLFFNINSFFSLFSLFFENYEMPIYTFIVIFFVLDVILIYSFLKGKKWSIVFCLVSSFLGIIFLWQFIFDKIDGILVDEGLGASIFIVASFLFFLYLEISCFFHPYFNQKKKPKEVLI